MRTDRRSLTAVLSASLFFVVLVAPGCGSGGEDGEAKTAPEGSYSNNPAAAEAKGRSKGGKPSGLSTDLQPK